MNQYIAAPAAVQPLTPPRPGTWLGEFWLEELLGKGGFGQAYLARDQRGQMVVLKVVIQEDGYREAMVLQAAACPGVPRLYTTFLSPYGCCLVQEHVPGETIESQQTRMRGRLPVADVMAIGWQVATTLATLHRKTPAVVHLDIKPGNLLLRTDGRVMLVDFGIAILAELGWPVIGGTPAYMPPEQLVRRAEPRSDVYALGATLWDLLAGVAPEPLHQRFPPLPPKYPRRLEPLLRDMLHLRPEQRPTAAEVAKHMEALVKEGKTGR